MDAASNTKVDEMRELLDTAQYMPVAGRFKVYIIDEVHMLSRHAFNAMLKTLEEPPEHVKFILATTDPQRLPVTILSRCLQFNLKPLTPPMLSGHLKRVLEAEGVACEDAALAQLARAAAGSVRDSLSLADQAIAHGGGAVTSAQVAEMLGSLGDDLVWPLLEKVVEGDGPGTVREAEGIAGRSVSLEGALEELAALLHRVALAQAGAPPPEDDPRAGRVRSMAARLDPARVQVLYQIAVIGRRDLPLAPDEFAGFSMALLRMLTFADPASSRAASAGAGDASHGAAPAAAPRAAVASEPAPRGRAPAAVQPAPAPREAAAPEQGAAPWEEESVARIPFEGDWRAFVEKLNLTGMAGMVARHGELASFDRGHLELTVPESHRMYSERAYQDKLKAALAPHFGPGFRLTVRVGSTSGASIAAVRSRDEAARQARAAEAIEEDPFVRELVRDLGAEVVSSSIRPSDDATGATHE